MTKEQAIAMLKAKRECIELDTNGNAELCDRNCGECKLNYEQGNMGEQKQALNMAIKALEQQPSDDEITITMKKGTLKYSGKGYVVYNKDWFRKHFATEVKIMTGYDGYIEQQPNDETIKYLECNHMDLQQAINCQLIYSGCANCGRHPNCPLVDIEERKVGKCTECNEYNQEKHYCPKFCDVIRDTTKDMQEFYKGEHEKLEQIKQIYGQWVETGDNADCWAFKEIGKVLEQE